MNKNDLEKKDKRYQENFIQKFFNKIVVGILYLISLLPFSILFVISDFLNFFIQHVFKYRRKVIFDNLHHAFPEKTEDEIKTIAREFYRHLTDLIVETIKMHGMNNKEISERITFKGLNKFEELFSENKSLIVLGMHHNNWEWASSVQLHTSHKLLMLYNPLRGNFALENFILKSREKWGGKCVPVHKSGRAVLEFNRAGRPTILWLGADQTPPASSKFWTVFLNREAPFFSGPEKIAARTNQPIYFHHTRKTGRGKYEVLLTPLIENPKDIDQKEILLRYVLKMEEIINEEPEHYLWSHRRWKHKRPENIPLTKKNDSKKLNRS
jgi:KDO2-lipid IV(A) lauroyltransferase